MSNHKIDNNECDVNEQSPTLSAAQTRRNFMSKFGKLAVITPIAVTALMSPTTSAAPRSCKTGGKFGC